MYAHHLDAMAQRIVAAGLVPAIRQHALRQVLDDYWRTRIALTWDASDVQEECPHLNEEEAIAVLQAVQRDSDSTVGVTWDTLHGAAVRLFGPHKARPLDEERQPMSSTGAVEPKEAPPPIPADPVPPKTKRSIPPLEQPTPEARERAERLVRVASRDVLEHTLLAIVDSVCQYYGKETYGLIESFCEDLRSPGFLPLGTVADTPLERTP